MSENPSTTLPGTVEKIIESPHPGVPEKARSKRQIPFIKRFASRTVSPPRMVPMSVWKWVWKWRSPSKQSQRIPSPLTP